MRVRNHLILIVPALLSLATPPVSAQSDGVPNPALRYHIPLDRLAIPPIATEEKLGYPPVTVDKRALLGLLQSGQYERLDQYLDSLKSLTRQRIQFEDNLFEAHETFASPDSSLGVAIAAWIAWIPSSAQARTANAAWYLARGWDARGEESASATSAGAMRRMEELTYLAADEASAALRLDSTNLMAYERLLGALLLVRGAGQARAVLDAGRRHNPGTYVLPYSFMGQLEPRWGGSYEAMARFAEEMAADSQLNSRLLTLRGGVEADRSHSAMVEGDSAGAIRHATAALRHGPELHYLLQRGNAYNYFGDNGLAIVDLNEVLRQRPQYHNALKYHGWAALSSASVSIESERRADLQQARADFSLLLSFAPTDKDARRAMADITFAEQHCPDDRRDCGGSDVGTWQTIRSLLHDSGELLGALGVLTFVSGWGFLSWIKGGMWLPGYVHLLALAALALVIVIDIMWVRSGLPMTLRRWLAIPIFPGIVYFLFIGLGGARWASRRRAMATPALRGPSPAPKEDHHAR